MPCSSSASLVITVGARSSALSRAQVQEILSALQTHHPHVVFDVHYMTTIGDRDQATSLRALDKTNFFTKEIDEAVLQGHCRVGIHSAKDLPQPLTEGLELLCLTKGVDPSDSLVLRDGETLQSLPHGACIATSSVRREEAVRELRSDFTFRDLRGTIEQRLAKLQAREADGIVVAEAALIRLGLTHLNRVHLPGATVAGQGQLAIVGRCQDEKMRCLFACLSEK